MLKEPKDEACASGHYIQAARFADKAMRSQHLDRGMELSLSVGAYGQIFDAVFDPVFHDLMLVYLAQPTFVSELFMTPAASSSSTRPHRWVRNRPLQRYAQSWLEPA